MTIIGITGGTGAGKTTLLGVLQGRGALILDCDEVYHELLSGCPDMISEIKKRFPEAAGENGIDRGALGGLVFSDRNSLFELNLITHKYVRAETARRIEDFAARGGHIAAIDAVELIESGIGKMCDITVAVTASADLRTERIMRREGISRRYAEMRIKAQKPDEYYADNCDYVIENNCGTAVEFQIKCEAFADKILGGFKNDR